MKNTERILKKENKQLHIENHELKDLLIQIIKAQSKSDYRDYVNLACWIICFTALILQTFRGL